MKSVRIIREDEAAVSPVIATILMVAITVVLAAVLYVMVSGLITGPGNTPKAMGVVVQRSTDGTNWTLLIQTAPNGLSTSGTFLTIRNAGGTIVLAAKAFSAITWATDRAIYQGDADTSVEPTESVLLSASTYPVNYRVEISDGTQILYSGILS